MTNFTRRTLVRGGTALAASGALTGPALLDWAKAWAQNAPWKPEPGAQLSMLRWKYFVQAEDDEFVKLMEAFAKATGVKVTISRKSYEDVQPKASVAANTGAGPDLFWGLYSLPHLFPQKCLDVTDVADYLGKKYGGWVPSAIAYGKGTGTKWIDIPICYTGSLINYRVSSLKKAGFSKFPTTTDEFLECAKATKKNGTPGGLALGHASGDGNTWAYWCLWAHGGNIVDKNDKVVINSPETEKALEFAKQLYENIDSRYRCLERCVEQQGVSRRRDPLDQQRNLDLRRRDQGRDQEGHRGGHGPRLFPGRSGRPSHRAASDVPDAGDELHQISAGLQSADRLHAGGERVQSVARSGTGLPDPLPQRL